MKLLEESCHESLRGELDKGIWVKFVKFVSK
jgi:hypothetical protein